MGEEPYQPYKARTERTVDRKWRAVVEFTYQATNSEQGRMMAMHLLAGVFPTEEEALSEAMCYGRELVASGRIKF